MKSMKKRILLALTAIVSTAIFLGCKKEDSPSIVGKWTATEETYTKYKNGEMVAKETISYDAVSKFLAEFNSNGKGVFYSIEYDDTDTTKFDYKVEGSNLIFYIENDPLPTTFALTNNTFTWYQSGEEGVGDDKYTWDDKILFTRQ